jgi:isoprenylcysteine carboxyl methyltransferase (ICMT) family protein YpbQ
VTTASIYTGQIEHIPGNEWISQLLFQSLSHPNLDSSSVFVAQEVVDMFQRTSACVFLIVGFAIVNFLMTKQCRY